MGLLLTIPATFAAERTWASRVLIDGALGIRTEVVVGSVTETRVSCAGEPGELVLAEGLFGTDGDLLRDASLPSLPLAQWTVGAELPEVRICERYVPVLYGRADSSGRWISSAADGSLRLGADLVGGAFLLLSRLEEALPAPRDAHGRLPGSESLAGRAGFLDRPLVDEYAEVLFHAMRRLWPRLARAPRAYRLVLSHDVDVPFCRDRLLRRVGGDLLTRRDARLAVRRCAARMRASAPVEGSDVCCTFDRIMDSAESAGIRTAFYFLAGGHGEPHSAAYRLDEPRTERILRRVADRGHEVGLHPSYLTHRDPQAIRDEFSSLRAACARLGIEQPSWGGRQHYLRWTNPVTWQAWADAGLDYDSTLTFADEPGFRSGTCRPYPAFNLHTREELDLVERPLVVMDGTLFDYKRLGPAEALATIEHLSARCRRVSGEFTLLWHNDRLITGSESRAFAEALRIAA